MADYTNFIGALNASEGFAVGPSTDPTLALTSSLVLQNISKATVTSTVAAQTLTASSLVSGASFTASAGGFTVPVQAFTTASTGTVNGYGVTTIKGGTSAGATITATLNGPFTGQTKVVHQLSPTTNAVALKGTPATSVTINASTNHVITFSSESTACLPLYLQGISTAAWILLSGTAVATGAGITISGT